MGPRLKLPRYVHGFIDRHGKPRYYVRQRGAKQVPLPGLPYSPEFMAAYSEALAGAPTIEPGAARTKPGTVAAAVAGYFGSATFAAAAKATRGSRRSILERFRAAHGDKGIATLARTHVERMVAARADAPASAHNFLAALRALMRYAVTTGLRSDDPTIGVRAPRYKPKGYPTWTEEDIAAFEARHPKGTKPRLALALLLYTAQRRADVVRMGRQHVRDSLLTVRQSKTGATLQIPLHPELQAVLAATPASNMTFLVGHNGKPYSAEAFGLWFKYRCREAGLPHLSAHGLRKAACRRLAELGCSAHVIAAISGHSTLQEVARYTAAADQVRLARQAVDALAKAHGEDKALTKSG
jgi:integrase